MSFLLFALPCFSCKDAPLTGSCVPKPGGETRHSRFVGRDNPSPLPGTRALNWPAMAALLHLLTASVRAGLSLRSLLTHFLGGPSTSTARSIEGCAAEVSGHQMPSQFPLVHSCGTDAKSASSGSGEQERSMMTTAEATRGCTGAQRWTALCPCFTQQGKRLEGPRHPGENLLS